MSKKRVQVSFSEGQWDLIELLRGEMGDSDAELIKSIVISWLAEKSMVSSSAKRKGGL